MEHFGTASSNNCASLVLYKQAEIFFFTKQLITNDITHTFKFSIPTVRKERDSIESTFRVYKNLFELIRRARKAPSKHACCFFLYSPLSFLRLEDNFFLSQLFALFFPLFGGHFLVFFRFFIIRRPFLGSIFELYKKGTSLMKDLLLPPFF